jgi:hypothetical protein
MASKRVICELEVEVMSQTPLTDDKAMELVKNELPIYASRQIVARQILRVGVAPEQPAR